MRQAETLALGHRLGPGTHRADERQGALPSDKVAVVPNRVAHPSSPCVPARLRAFHRLPAHNGIGQDGLVGVFQLTSAWQSTCQSGYSERNIHKLLRQMELSSVTFEIRVQAKDHFSDLYAPRVLRWIFEAREQV